MKKQYLDALHELTACVPEELGEVAFKITDKEISNDEAAKLIAYASYLIEAVRESVHAARYFCEVDVDRVESVAGNEEIIKTATKAIEASIALKTPGKEIRNDDVAKLLSYSSYLIKEAVMEYIHDGRYFCDIDADRLASGKRLEATIKTAVNTIEDETGHDHVFEAIEKMANLIKGNLT